MSRTKEGETLKLSVDSIMCIVTDEEISIFPYSVTK